MRFHEAWIITGDNRVLKGWVSTRLYGRVMNGNPLQNGQAWDFFLDDRHKLPNNTLISIRQVLAVMEAELPVACKN